MRCDGTEIEEEEAGQLPLDNEQEPLDFEKEPKTEYEKDSINNGPERDSLDDEFSRDGTYEMPDVFGGNF